MTVVTLPLSVTLTLTSNMKPRTNVFATVITKFIVSTLNKDDMRVTKPATTFTAVITNVITGSKVSKLIVTAVLTNVFLILVKLYRFKDLVGFVPFAVAAKFASKVTIAVMVKRLGSFFKLACPSKMGPVRAARGFHTIIRGFSAVGVSTLVINTMDLTILVVTPCVFGEVPKSLVTIVVKVLVIRFLPLGISAVKGLCAVDGSLPSFRLPTMSLRIIRGTLPGTFAVTILTTVRSLLSYIITSKVVGNGRHSSVRLMTRKTNGVTSTLFNKVPTAKTVTEATTGVGGKKHAPVTKVIRSVALIVILIMLVPCTKVVPVPAVTTVLFVITCGVYR